MIRTLCRGTALYDDRRRTNLHHVGDSSKIQNELVLTVKGILFRRFFPETPEVSELEIALLFPLRVASFAPFLLALSPRLYCEGVDEMGGEEA